MTTAYFTFASITHLRYRNREQIEDSSSPWHGWKWLSQLFMSAILWESVIAFFYWTLLFRLDYPNLTPTSFVCICLDHAIPITALVGDYFLNRIYFEWNQLTANIIVFALYGCINITATFVSGTPVYPPLSWDSVTSIALGMLVFVFAFGFYTMWYFLTKCKFRRILNHGDKKESKQLLNSSPTESQVLD